MQPLKFIQAAKEFLGVKELPIPEVELIQGEPIKMYDPHEALQLNMAGFLSNLPKLPSNGDVLVATDSGDMSWSTTLQDNVDMLMQKQLPYPTASNQMLVSKNGHWEPVLVEDFIIGMFPELGKKKAAEEPYPYPDKVAHAFELLKSAGVYIKDVSMNHYPQELTTVNMELALNPEAVKPFNEAVYKLKGY